MIRRGFIAIFVLVLLFLISTTTVWSLTVDAPKKGDQWLLGSTKYIKWTTGGVTQFVRIILRRNNQVVGVIAQHYDTPQQAPQQSYKWKVGQHVNGMAEPGDDYYIRIRVNGSTPMKDSGTFSIIKPVFKPGPGFGKGWIKVTQPHKGDFWNREGTYLVKWEFSSKATNSVELLYKGTPGIKKKIDQKFKIDLYDKGGKKMIKNIAEYTPFTGSGFMKLKGKYSYPWTIPGDTKVGKHKIRVSTFNGVVDGFSSVFGVRTSGKKETITIPGQTVNKVRIIKRTYDNHILVKLITFEWGEIMYGLDEYSYGCGPTEDPGPGKMRVGKVCESIMDGEITCVHLYRSFVYFDLSSIKKDRYPIKASISYKKFMGGNCNILLYALNKKWSGKPGDLFDHIAIGPVLYAPSNVTSAVHSWLKNQNYGVVFVYHNQSNEYDGENCLGLYDDVKLTLEFIGY